jgi:hypothetical protein
MGGLMDYKARFYSPMLGRFLQPDTITPGGPQGLNRYAYVLNNPINASDPSGHKCVGEPGECLKGDDKTPINGGGGGNGGGGREGGRKNGGGEGGRKGDGDRTPTPTPTYMQTPTSTSTSTPALTYTPTPTPTSTPMFYPSSTPTTTNCDVLNCPTPIVTPTPTPTPTPTLSGIPAVLLTFGKETISYALLGEPDGFAGPGLGQNIGNIYSPAKKSGSILDGIVLGVSFVFSVGNKISDARSTWSAVSYTPSTYSVSTPTATRTSIYTSTYTPTPFYRP